MEQNKQKQQNYKQCIKVENRRKIRKYLEINGNRNTKYQIL
jgi:hypothetical protein